MPMRSKIMRRGSSILLLCITSLPAAATDLSETWRLADLGDPTWRAAIHEQRAAAQDHGRKPIDPMRVVALAEHSLTAPVGALRVCAGRLSTGEMHEVVVAY